MRTVQHNMQRNEAEAQVKDDECSYRSMTIIAVVITLASAGVTFLIANQMYTGTEAPPLEIGNASEIKWNKAEKMIVKEKEVVVAKTNNSDICYVMPLRLAKRGLRLRPLGEPLREPLLMHFAGEQGMEFCEGRQSYLLEKQDSIRARRSSATECTTLILNCSNDMMGITKSCLVQDDFTAQQECFMAKMI